MSDHLFKRGDIYFCWFYDVGGKLLKRSTHCRDRRAALARLKQYERTAAGAPGATQDAPAYPVSDLLEDLIRDGLLDVAPQTVRMYVEKSGHLLRLLGDFNAHDLGTAHVKKYICDRLEEGAARSTVSKELVTLRRALAHAHDAGRYFGDPKAPLPRFRAPYVPRRRWLTQDEFPALLRTLQPHRQLWVMVAVYTGGRDSEVDGLLWENIDWRRRTVVLFGTKTEESFRSVPLHPLLGQALMRSRQARGPVVGEWQNVRRDLAAACARAGIDKVTPNDLRRTYASWMKQAGIDNGVLRRLLGHSSTRMVDLVYGQVDDGMLQRAVNQLPGGDQRWEAGGKGNGVTGGIGGKGGPPFDPEVSLSSVLGVGIEPTTRGFSVRASSAESARLEKTYGAMLREREARGKTLNGGRRFPVQKKAAKVGKR